MWAQISSVVPELHWGMILVYVRIQACVLVVPGFGARAIPARIKIMLAMAITPLLASREVGVPAAQIDIIHDVVVEMLVGLAIGALLRLMAVAVDIAATAIAATASLSQIIGVQNEAAPHPLGSFLHLGGIAILMTLGLPIMVVELIADSLHLWPTAQGPDPSILTAAAIGFVAKSFGLGLLIAAPFTLGGFLFQALSGTINRVMPSLPVVFIGSPASILLALTGLTLLAPMLIEIWALAVLDLKLPLPG